MTSRRIKLLNKLIGSATGEDEAKLYKLTTYNFTIYNIKDQSDLAA